MIRALEAAQVRAEHLKFRHTYYLGFAALSFLLLLMGSGVAMMFYYHPYPSMAYQDMKDLRYAVFLGRFIRNVHRWSAQGMVLIVVLHMVRVFFTASYKRPRQFNWNIGVLLLLAVLGMGFTGYLLPWDQLAYWSSNVGTSIAGKAPGLGPLTRMLLVGGQSVGPSTLLRFFVLHTSVIPAALVVLLGIHLFRIRGDGGLSRPLWKLERGQPEPDPLGELPPEEKADLVPAIPHALARQAGTFFAVTIAVFTLALLFDAPLDELASPAKTPNPPKAPWYFIGLQELVSHSTFVGGILVPTLAVLALLAIPYLDRNPSRWPADRKLVLVLFAGALLTYATLVVIGLFFRGPGWAFVLPWAASGGGVH